MEKRPGQSPVLRALGPAGPRPSMEQEISGSIGPGFGITPEWGFKSIPLFCTSFQLSAFSGQLVGIFSDLSIV